MIKLLIAIAPTVILTVYGQIITKWRVTHLYSRGQENLTIKERLFNYLTDPFIISAYFCGLLAAIAWLYVAEKFPISVAFPIYTGVVFACVAIGSVLFLNEKMSFPLLAGMALIVVGIIVMTRAYE